MNELECLALIVFIICATIIFWKAIDTSFLEKRVRDLESQFATMLSDLGVYDMDIIKLKEEIEQLKKKLK